MSTFYSPYIIIPLVTWAIAQFLKFLIKAGRGDLDFRYLFASGGMPSVHSAAICALAVTALAYDGYHSPLFGIAAVLAAVVMYDSFGVRRASGDQAVAINAILDNLKGRQLDQVKLREVHGHRPSEVISGAALGVFIAFLMSIRHWSSKIDLLTQPPLSYERTAYLIIFSIFIIKAVAVAIMYGRRRYRQTKTLKAARKFVSGSLLGLGILGLFTSLLQYQQIENGEWRVWSLLIIGVAVALYGLSWYYWLRFVPNRYRQELAKKQRG